MRSPLGTRPMRLGAGREVGGREAVATVLVGVAHDDDGVAPRAQHAPQLAEERPHALEVLGVRGAVGEVGRVVGDHGVVGAPVGEALGQRPAGHRHLAAAGCRAGRWPRSPRWRRRGRPMSRRGIAHQQPAARGVEGARAARDRCRPGRAAPPRPVALGEAPPRPPRRPPPSAARARSPGPGAGARQMAAPSSVPPTPAKGSSTSSPGLVKNSMSRAMSRGGLLAPWALRAACPSSDG